MSDASTTHLIGMYVSEATPVPFLTQLFKTPERNFYTSEKVAIDILRDDVEVAIAIQDLSVGTRENELTTYQNKGFTPPIYNESATITAWDMLRKQPGQTEFLDPDYMANAMEAAFRIFRRLELKIRRAIELQASQVLQTGKVTLTDSGGRALYNLDFGPRSTHFPTTVANWGGGSDDPMGDISALGDEIRRNGRQLPNRLIFGKRAWRNFFNHSSVRSLFNSIRLNIGEIAPRMDGGASFKGRITIDSYEYEMFVYDGFYTDPVTRATKSFVDPDSVIMLSENSRLDLAYGAIPMVRRPEAPALPFLPPRISDGDTRLDLTPNAWFTPDGMHLKVSVGTRPLTIPTAIDTFGCLKTKI